MCILTRDNVHKKAAQIVTIVLVATCLTLWFLRGTTGQWVTWREECSHSECKWYFDIFW